MASINYDTRTGRVLPLSALFRPGSNYLARLSQLAIASLEQDEFAERSAIRHVAGAVESNFKVFTLTDTTLILHFPTYQVAAGAAGPRGRDPTGHAGAATSETMILCERNRREWVENGFVSRSGSDFVRLGWTSEMGSFGKFRFPQCACC